MRQTDLSHQFVEFIPERLQEGVLYISLRYGTAVHKCFCGCGKEVVTPLTPTDWSLKMDGNVVTMRPSIGNWSLTCQSHYWIQKNKVIWAGQLSREQIERGRATDRTTKQVYFEAVNRRKTSRLKSLANGTPSRNMSLGFLYSLWLAIKRWWNSLKR